MLKLMDKKMLKFLCQLFFVFVLDLHGYMHAQIQKVLSKGSNTEFFVFVFLF